MENLRDQPFEGFLDYPNAGTRPPCSASVNACHATSDVWRVSANWANFWRIKLFIQAYILKKVEITDEREENGEAVQLTRKVKVIPLKVELEQVFGAYEKWLARMVTEPSESAEREVSA